MISWQEAQKLILDQTHLNPRVQVFLREASGRVLAQEIISPMDSPSFDNSAMDGYAIRSEETLGANQEHPLSFLVPYIIAAGEKPSQKLKSGEAARIFTGAMIPPGADAVVIQEDVLEEDGKVNLQKPVKAGANIRQRGEEIKKGDSVLGPGSYLNPAAIGLLSSLGVHEVQIYSSPRVGILITGSEIISQSESLKPGQIFDSNSFSLVAALEELNLKPSFKTHVSDNKEELRDAIQEGLEDCDYLIVTGGVSVGDYDFVREVAIEQGIKEILWKVKQKPGKPLWYGRNDKSQCVFGLPGNPASVLVCFYEYVRPALLHGMGFPSPFLTKLNLPLKNEIKKKPGKAHFLRGRADFGNGEPQVELLQQQGSHIMKSFSHANCLIQVPEEIESISKGEPVEVHLLPSLFLPGGF